MGEPTLQQNIQGTLEGGASELGGGGEKKVEKCSNRLDRAQNRRSVLEFFWPKNRRHFPGILVGDRRTCKSRNDFYILTDY